MSGHENLYQRLPGPGDPTDGDIYAHGAPHAFNMAESGGTPALGSRTAGAESTGFVPAEGRQEGTKIPATSSITLWTRAAMTFFIVGVVIPCLSLALGTAQCIVFAQWLPGEHLADACFDQPAMCLSLGLSVSGISLGIHGFLWLLQLLWAHM
jgi:hypothetical protein